MEQTLLHITTAQGPAECQLAAAKVLGSLLADLRKNDLSAKVIERIPGQENGAILSATISIEGTAIQQHLVPWLGTIQWIQKSTYRPNHGRKNWFVGIFELQINAGGQWTESELVFQSVRSSGAGGQHVNKVSSAVRATHPPTGISVFAQDSRSQLQNKKLALERIRKKLEDHFLQQTVGVADQQWLQHTDLERGNPVKVFSGMDFKPKKEQKTFKTKRNKLKQELSNQLKKNDNHDIK